MLETEKKAETDGSQTPKKPLSKQVTFLTNPVALYKKSKEAKKFEKKEKSQKSE